MRVIDFLRFSLDLLSPPVDLRLEDDFLVDDGVPLASGAAAGSASAGAAAPSSDFLASADSPEVSGCSAGASLGSFLSSLAVESSVRSNEAG